MMLVALAALAVAAPVGAGHAAGSVGAAAKAKPAPLKATAEVYDQEPGFLPRTITIRKGGTIKWNGDSSLTDFHTVTYLRGPAKYFKSPSIGANASYSRKFSKAGRYMIYCTFHAGNTQNIIVK